MHLNTSNTPGALRQLTLAIALALPALGVSQLALAAGNQTQQFDIPTQPLADALNAFIATSDWQVGFPAGLAQDVRANPVYGQYTPQQALDKLVAGKGLAVRQAKDGSMTLVKSTTVEPTPPQSATTLPTMKVTGKTEGYEDGSADPYNPDYNRTNATTATKTNTPIMETPFSIQVVPKQVLQDQQVVRVEDATKNVSGVMKAGNIGNGVDSFLIRGFDTSNSVYRNGVLFPSVLGSSGFGLKRDTANLERIEVLKGPASILYGRAEPGGIVNLVTKQPLASPFYSLQQQFGSYDFYRTTADATGPITKDDTLLYRLNMDYENSGSFQDFVDNKRVFVAPVVKWNISPKTQATLELEYLHTDNQLQSPIPNLGNRPVSAPRSYSFGQPWSDQATDDMLVGINWSHALNDNWTLQHRFNANFTEQGGDGAAFATKFQPDGSYTVRTSTVKGLEADRYFNTVNLTGKFDTGVLHHSLVFGGDYYRTNEKIDNQYCCPPIGTSSISNPVYLAPLADLETSKYAWGPISHTTEWYGIFLQDQVKLPFNLHALAGLRYDNAVTEDNLMNATINDDDQVSPRGGLLWRPLQWLSLYGSYTENFGASNGFDSNGKAFSPQTAQQWEMGGKTEFWNGQLTATLSYFELTKQNLQIPDPNNLPFGLIAVGEAQTHGVELDVAGEILPGWRVIGNYTYMPFAQITKSNDLADTPVGNRLGNVPRNMGSLWSTYEFQYGTLSGFKFGAGAIAVDERQGRDTDDYQLPGYVTMNAMASYDWKIGASKFTAQVNIDNLLDKTYFQTGGSYYGAPRTVLGSIRVSF
ncbi:MAG: TonB-dependent receptor [Methylovulum sp.]|nr:TonB-dependent receptor [Methylovulum sp.]